MTSQRGIPRIASVTVDRLALFDKLDRAAPVTFITAPPGFGKTTGLVRWLERSPLEDTTVVWAHLHLDDTVPQRFWMIVADAFAKAGVRVDGRAEQDVWAAIRRHHGGLLLVVDAAERLADDAPAEKLIECTYAEKHFKVTFLSRRDPAPKAWVSHEMDAVSIEPHDLRLSPDETRHLFWKLGAGSRELDLPYVHAQLAGWPALLHRAASRLAETGSLGSSAQTVLHGIAAEMWEQSAHHWLDEETMAFCARLALAVHIDGDVIKLVAGVVDNELDLGSAMDAIERCGWLRRSGAAQQHWQFVPVVRSLLRNNNRGWDTGALHEALIGYYVDSGQWESALEQAAEHGDMRVLTDLIGEHWLMIMLAARDELRTALNQLPSHILYENSAIRSAYEILERSQFAGAPAHDDVEFPELAADELAEFVHRLMATIIAARFAGRFEHAAQLSHQAAEWARGIIDSGQEDPAVAEDPETASALVTLVLQSAICLQLDDQLNTAFELFEFANRQSRLDTFGFVARNAHGAIAMHLATKGDMVSARSWARKESAYPKIDGWIENRVATSGNLARGRVALESLDESAAREAMRPLNAQRDDDEYWAFIVELQTATELMWGNPGALLTELEQVHGEYEHLAAPGSYAYAAMKRCMIDLHVAQSVGSVSARLVDPEDDDHPALACAYARIALLTGQWQKSVAMTLKHRDFTVRQWCEAALIRAAAHVQSGNTRDAPAAAIAALRAMERYGLRTPLLGLPRSHAERLLPIAGSYQGFVSEILEADIRWQFPETLRLIELTASEALVLDGLARDMTAAAIAAETFLSVNTIKTHTRTLYRKLGVSSRAEALVRAHKLGVRDTWRVPQP